MGKIIRLDEKLANMIAAGEVVENPASVVKELVENALDAKSTRIEVDLEGAGMKRIRVIDDGEGMAHDDVDIALERHATSKIKTEHDLHHIQSLGFRGEALPSIASVSTLTLESSDGATTARRLTIKNGRRESDTIGTMKQGTAISVEGLFYNTPARLKHLKGEPRELSMVVDYIHKLALAHPRVRFTLTHDRKTLFHTTGDGNTQKILYQIYGADVAKSMMTFTANNAYFSIRGTLAKPAHTRSARRHVTLITNGRVIKNTRIVKAVIDGYKTYLPTHQYPIALLEIDVDPLLIDINIHPQKLDIKFSEERRLIELIETNVRQTLVRADLTPTAQKTTPYHQPDQTRMDLTDAIEEPNTPYQTPKPEETSEPKSRQTKATSSRFPDIEYIGQYAGTYLLFQNDEGLYMLDQHAAAERIRYEQYYRAMQADRTTQQTLLTPIAIDLTGAERIALQGSESVFEAIGIHLDITDAAANVTAVPTWFPTDHVERYTEAAIETVLDERDLAIGPLIDHVAKELSCKHSIRANKHLSRDEINVLMRNLANAHNPFTCPHGRPTLIKLTTHEIERMFKRVMS